MHLGDLSVFMSCAMSLAVFDISKYVENGVVIEPVYEGMAGAIRYDDLTCSNFRSDNYTLQPPQAI
jgi:hypothetical protein